MSDDHKLHLSGPRAIELFAGIGGFAAACPRYQVVAAYDVNQLAGQVYQANYSAPYLIRELESLPLDEFCQWEAEMWWMSPPCQPYTHRGVRRDIRDTRARSLLKLIDALPHCVPKQLALENVTGFANSDACQLLTSQLKRCGYRWQQFELCPTQLGWPNRRPRFYLLACREGNLRPWHPRPNQHQTLGQLLEVIRDEDPRLVMQPKFIEQFGSVIDRIDPSENRPAACFASSYGRALLNSGSYVVRENRCRRMHPREVANLLGFPRTFILPSSLSYRQLWKLLGNSLSLPAVQFVLSHLD